jgi:hypothetical protein
MLLNTSTSEKSVVFVMSNEYITLSKGSGSVETVQLNNGFNVAKILSFDGETRVKLVGYSS